MLSFMKHKDYRQQKKRVMGLFEVWRPRVGVQNFKLTYTWSGTVDEDYVMKTGGKWQYLDAWIDVCLPRCLGLTDDELEWVVVHELLHVALLPIGALGTERHDLEERVCTELAWAFVRMK